MNNKKDSHKNSHIHDLAFKDALRIEEICIEFLERFLNRKMIRSWKTNTIKYMPTDFIDQEHREKRADILVSIESKSRKKLKQFVYILFEHKSTVDKDVSEQLLKYITCIIENQKKNEGRSFPIIPIVFYHGERKWNVSKYLLGRKYKNKYIFNFSYKLINIQNSKLNQSHN